MLEIEEEREGVIAVGEDARGGVESEEIGGLEGVGEEE